MSNMLNAMDVWQIFCYLNVFFVLVEYCIVLWLSKGVSIENAITIKEPNASSKSVEIVILTLAQVFSTTHMKI